MWADWIERHMKRLELAGRATKTVCERRRYLTAFAKFCQEAGVREPEGLGRELVRAYGAWVRTRISARGNPAQPRTVNGSLFAARDFLAYLAGEGKVSARLAGELPALKEPRRLPRGIPSDADVGRMIEAIPVGTAMGVRDRAIVEVLYSTGLRRSELAALKLEDVNLVQGTVQVVCGKGWKSRVVPLGSEAAKWLKLYLVAVRPAWSRPEEEAVFVAQHGVGLTPGWITEKVTRLGEAVGLKLAPHALRKACATEMIRAGAPLYHVKELLGHESLRTLAPYVGLTIVDLLEAHRRYHPRERGVPPSGE